MQSRHGNARYSNFLLPVNIAPEYPNPRAGFFLSAKLFNARAFLLCAIWNVKYEGSQAFHYAIIAFQMPAGNSSGKREIFPRKRAAFNNSGWRASDKAFAGQNSM